MALDKKFHTTVYPKDEIYWAQLKGIMNTEGITFINWFNDRMIEYVDNNCPIGTPITSYVMKHIERPPLPWENRAKAIRKYRNMTKEQLRKSKEDYIRHEEIIDSILDEKERFELE